MSADRSRKSGKKRPRDSVKSRAPVRSRLALPALTDRSELEARYREDAQADPDALILEYWPDGTVRWASESLRTVLGWDPDRVVGTRWRLTPPQWQEQAVRMFRYAVYRRVKTLRTLMPGMRADGTVVWIQGDSYFLWRPDGTLGSIVAWLRVVPDPVTLDHLPWVPPQSDSGGDLPGQ